MTHKPALPHSPVPSDVGPRFPDIPAETISIGGKDIAAAAPPGGLVVRGEVGLLMHRTLSAQTIAMARPPRLAVELESH